MLISAARIMEKLEKRGARNTMCSLAYKDLMSGILCLNDLFSASNRNMFEKIILRKDNFLPKCSCFKVTESHKFSTRQEYCAIYTYNSKLHNFWKEMARHFGIVWGALSRVSLSPRFSDPLGEVRKLYDFLRMTLTPDTESAFRHYLEDVPKNAKFRGHKYTMEQFDLTKEDLQGEFKEYIDHMIRKGFPEEDIL